MANLPIPTQIDYTSRDFLSLREDMIARVRTAIPEWNPTDTADFGVVLIEAFAYMGDMLSYYTDRAANESTLSTATRRASVVALARDLGYEPGGYTPSTVDITVSNSSTTAAIDNLYAGTVFTAPVESGGIVYEIPFETTEDITIAADTSVVVTCTQGETKWGPAEYGEVLGTSYGTASQIFEIPDSQVVKETVQVYVFDGVNHYPWQRVEHMVDYTPLSRVYRVRDTGTGSVFVEFGDGVSGMVPPNNHVITATYRVVDGLRGNIPAGVLHWELTYVPTLTVNDLAALSGLIGISNDAAASGGTDPEELESIRYNAAQAYRTTTRAVSLEDYQNIALSVPSCGKASAMSSIPGTVVVAVAPYRNSNMVDPRPGFQQDPDTLVWSTTDAFETLKTSVLSTITKNALVGSTTSITNPVYSPMTIALSAVVLPSVRAVDATTLIRQTILEKFDYSRVNFGASVFENDLIALIASLGVTSSITVTGLARDVDPDPKQDINAADDEILLLYTDDLTVTTSGGAG